MKPVKLRILSKHQNTDKKIGDADSLVEESVLAFQAAVPAVNVVRLVVGGGWLPGFSTIGVRVQAGGGRRLGRHVPRAAAPPER